MPVSDSAQDLLTILPGKPEVLWREQPEDEVARADAEARLWERTRNYRLAEEWTGKARTPELPVPTTPVSLTDYNRAESLADSIRRSLDLGSYPAFSLVTALEENLGVKVLYDRDLPGSAVCLRDEDNAAIAINSSEVPWRRNYSIAHEFYHLVCWKAMPPERLKSDNERWAAAERMVEAFASALLPPSDVIRDRYLSRGNAEWQPVDLIDLAREFGVSTEALVWRLVSLRLFTRPRVRKLLEDKKFRALDRAFVRPRSEPEMLPPRFVRLLYLAYVKGKVSAGRVAEMTGQNLIEVRRPLAALERVMNHG